MSVFQPLDVRRPVSRRKQLVQRLMQQHAAQAPARSALMSVSSHPLGAPGSRMGGEPQGHGHNSVLAAILSKLGVQGPADSDSGFGHHITQVGNDPYGSGHYVGPNEVSPNQGTPIPGSPTQNPTSGLRPDGSYIGDQAYSAQFPNDDPDSLGAMSGPPEPNNGFIPLGGGMYYDPIQNQVVGGNAHTGGAQI